jgi:tRNA threonylcarbamoyladenosine biosynthesis protein TsaE
MLCQTLGVKDNPSSPTFSIVNEYASENGPLYHFDFYRLKSETEAFDLGYEEYFYSDNYCFVEWPEKIANLLPIQHLKITLETTENQSRIFTVEKK